MLLYMSDAPFHLAGDGKVCIQEVNSCLGTYPQALLLACTANSALSLQLCSFSKPMSPLIAHVQVVRIHPYSTHFSLSVSIQTVSPILPF